MWATDAVVFGQPPVRLGWLRTGWALLLAYFCSGLLLFLGVTPLWVLGLLDQRGARVLPGLITGPYYPGGVWAIATDLSVAAVILAVTTLAIEWTLRWQVGYAVSRRLLFLTLAVTGWAPALGMHPLFASSGLAFVPVLVLVRRRAAPVAVTEPEHWPWKQLVTLLLLSVLLIGSYTTFHPLRTSGLGGGPSGASAVVRNNGLGTVTLIGIDTRAYVWPALLHRHISGLILRPHTSVMLNFRTQCPPTVVHLRYRLFGRIWSQPLPLPMSCPQ
jgi:hypothetical protein